MQTNLQNVIEYKINIVTILLLKNHIWSCQRIKRERINRERIKRERIRRHRREGCNKRNNYERTYYTHK